jgi:hypothetical protein
MMENASRPTPPAISEGCFNCGSGKDKHLDSYLRNGTSIALCKKCASLPMNDLSRQPYNVRAS